METRSSSSNKRPDSALSEPELAEMQKQLRDKESRLREESRSLNAEREYFNKELEQLRREREQSRLEREKFIKEREQSRSDREKLVREREEYAHSMANAQALAQELQKIREEYAAYKTRVARTETFSNLQSQNEATPIRTQQSEAPLQNDTPRSEIVPGNEDRLGFPRSQHHLGDPNNPILVNQIHEPINFDAPRVTHTSGNVSISKSDSIMLRDAIEAVPNFDGSKPPIYQFLRACRRAQEMIPAYLESLLTRQIINKLRDRAYLVLEDTRCGNITQLCDRLRNAFGESLTSWEARGELARIFQKPDEHMLDYIGRVKDLRETIRDCERIASGQLTSSVKIEIDDFTIKCFKRGIIPQLRDKPRLACSNIPADTFDSALALYREYLTDRERYNQAKKGRPPEKKATSNSSSDSKGKKCTHCHKTGHTDDTCWSKHGKPKTGTDEGNKTSNSGSDQVAGDKFCKYCKTRGHELSDCKKRQFNEAKKRESNSGNEQGLQASGANLQKTVSNAPNQVFHAQASELCD